MPRDRFTASELLALASPMRSALLLSSTTAILGALLLALTTTARADVIPDGYKSIKHEISVDGLAKQGEYTFVLFPTDMAGTAQVVTDGEPVGFYHMASPYLYAVRGELPPLDEIDEAWLTEHGALKSPYALRKITSIQESDPTERVVTVHVVTAVTDTALLMALAEQRLDGHGNPVNDQARFVQHTMPWILTGIGLALIVFMFGRRQRPPTRPAAVAGDSPAGVTAHRVAAEESVAADAG